MVLTPQVADEMFTSLFVGNTGSGFRGGSLSSFLAGSKAVSVTAAEKLN